MSSYILLFYFNSHLLPVVTGSWIVTRKEPVVAGGDIQAKNLVGNAQDR
jgi:hypothetical protein